MFNDIKKGDMVEVFLKDDNGSEYGRVIAISRKFESIDLSYDGEGFTYSFDEIDRIELVAEML